MVNCGLINVWCVLYPPPALMGAPLPPTVNQLQADRISACMYTRWGNTHLHLLCLTSLASVFSGFVFSLLLFSLIFFSFPFLVFLDSFCVVSCVCDVFHFSYTPLHPHFILAVPFSPLPPPPCTVHFVSCALYYIMHFLCHLPAPCSIFILLVLLFHPLL